MSLRTTDARLTIAAHDFATLVEFYCQALNLTPATWMPGVYAEFHLPSLRLGIFQPRHPLPPTPLPSSPTGMGLCLEVENLESAIAHLTSLGYPPAGTIRTASHGREIDIRDPEGNWLILHQSPSVENGHKKGADQAP